MIQAPQGMNYTWCFFSDLCIIMNDCYMKSFPISVLTREADTGQSTKLKRREKRGGIKERKETKW